MCNDTAGYRLEGARNVSCLEGGSWSAKINKTICRGTVYRLQYIYRRILISRHFTVFLKEKGMA